MTTTVQQFAGHYIGNMGWEVVPLIGKACFDEDWQQRRYDIRHFNGSSNIGIRSTKGLVVADDDFPMPAVECADTFIPQTGAVYGRPSNPRCKRLFFCPELAESVTLTDIDGAHLYQLRVNHQDMAPPSIHPDTRERLKWDGLLRGAQRIEKEHLILWARYYWAARLIALNWPGPGRRHDSRNAYASVLLGTLGIPEPIAEKILEWACRLGGSDAKGIRDVSTAIRSTRQRLESGGRATGGPTVARLLPDNDVGARLVRLLRKAFGKTNELDTRIDELNERFFLIDVGTQTVVGEEVQRDYWTDFQFRAFADFQRKLVKQSVQVGVNEKTNTPILKPLAGLWLSSPKGTQFENLVWSPPGSGVPVGPQDLNGWKGFTVEPARGDWSITREKLLFEVMCRENKEQFEWVMDWMAATFQQPGQHGETSIVGVGPQGVGKNVWANYVMARTFDGRHARVTTHIRQVLGEFNDILSGLCLLVLDEIGLTTDSDYNAMKGLITGHTIDINRKGIRINTEPSMLHVIFLSNHDTPLKVASDDRRFAFFHFADTHQNNTKLFASVVDELNSKGGRAAMLFDLLARKVDWDRLRLAPDSDTKQAAKRENWTVTQWFLYRQLREKREDWKGDLYRVLKKDWVMEFDVYVRSLSRHDVPRDGLTELRKELRRVCPLEWNYNRPVSEQNVLVRDYWTLPPWDVFRKWLEVAVGCSLNDLDDETGVKSDEPPF